MISILGGGGTHKVNRIAEYILISWVSVSGVEIAEKLFADVIYVSPVTQITRSRVSAI